VHDDIILVPIHVLLSWCFVDDIGVSGRLAHIQYLAKLVLMIGVSSRLVPTQYLVELVIC
jgi:hypothetical protein